MWSNWMSVNDLGLGHLTMWTLCLPCGAHTAGFYGEMSQWCVTKDPAGASGWVTATHTHRHTHADVPLAWIKSRVLSASISALGLLSFAPCGHFLHHSVCTAHVIWWTTGARSRHLSRYLGTIRCIGCSKVTCKQIWYMNKTNLSSIAKTLNTTTTCHYC